MYCPNCGSQVEEGALFCDSCGTKLEEESVNVSAAEGENNSADVISEEQAPKKKFPVKALAAAAAVVAVAGVGITALGGRSYEKPVKDIVKLLNNETVDVEKYIDAAFPKFVTNAYKNAMPLVADIDVVEDAMEEIDDSLKDIFEEMKDNYGKNAKIKYEVKDVDEMKKRDLSEVEDSLDSLRDEVKDYMDEDSYVYGYLEDEMKSDDFEKLEKLADDLVDDLKDVKVTEGYILEIEAIVEGSEDDDDAELTFGVIKVNGEWCVDPSSLGRLGIYF